MRVAVAGAIDGDIVKFYEEVDKIPGPLDWILCTGNFGVWPDRNRIDKATRLKGKVGDFAKLYVSGWIAPVPLIFVAGSHEDHRWLKHRESRGDLEILPGITYLVQGNKTTIGKDEEILRVTGLGKVYSYKTFNWTRRTRKFYRHYTRNELNRACASGPTDILITHEAPNGISIGGFESKADGIRNLIYATQPKLVIHAAKKNDSYTCVGTQCLALKPGEIRIINYSDGKISI